MSQSTLLWSGSPSGLDCSMKSFIQVIANEIIDNIASYIPVPSDQYSLMCSCRALHWPVARQMYRHVTVSDYKARRFFKTITESPRGYEYFIKSLEYRATSNTDVHLTHVLFRDAIPKLYNMEQLILYVRSSLSTMLRHLLKNSAPNPSLDTLPKLRSFRLHGDIRLMKYLNYNKIEKIELTEPFTDDEFTQFVDTVVPSESGVNLNIVDLTLTFNYPQRKQIVYVIFRVGDLFPNLRRFSIRGTRIKALDVTQMLTLDPPLLPELAELEVNQISMTFAELISNAEDVSDDLYALKRTHIFEAGLLRPNLRRVTFGDASHVRIPHSDSWELDQSRTEPTDEDIEMLPHNFGGRPLEWMLEYSRPLNMTELEAFHTKRNLKRQDQAC